MAFILVGAVAANVLASSLSNGEEHAPWLGLALWAAILVTSLISKPDWSVTGTAGRGRFSCLAGRRRFADAAKGLPEPSWQTAFGLGLLSSVFDNIPLTALALRQGGYDWALLSFAVGFGGSMVWFGSSAGVALTNAIPKGGRSRAGREGWFVPVGYVVGFFVMLALLGWAPTSELPKRDVARGSPADARRVSLLPEPLQIPAFRAYWLARLTTTIGQMAMVIVIGWQVYDIARETMGIKEAALRLGIIGLVQFVPLFVLTLVSGWTADRLDRRWIARASIALELGCARWPGSLHGHHHACVLYGVAALLGVARAFAGPALGALAPNLVPRKILPKAIALSSIAWQTGAIAGPAVGGFLYAWSPEPLTSAARRCSRRPYLPVAISRLPGHPSPRRSIPGRRWSMDLRYVRRNRLVLGAISLDLFAVLLGGATAMLPVFARDMLHVGPEGLGLLRAAPAVGATLTAIFFAIRPLKSGVGVKMLLAVAVFGAATRLRPVPHMALSLACLALLGAADMFSVYVRQSLIQLYTPDAMRGRVGAVSSLFISASNELGEAESGFIGALIGPVAAVIAGGVARSSSFSPGHGGSPSCARPHLRPAGGARREGLSGG